MSLLCQNDKLKENNCHPTSDIVLAFAHNMHNHTDFLELGEQLFHYNLEVIHKLGGEAKKTENVLLILRQCTQPLGNVPEN